MTCDACGRPGADVKLAMERVVDFGTSRRTVTAEVWVHEDCAISEGARNTLLGAYECKKQVLQGIRP